MNEFTVGFEVDFEGMSERFVSEEAFKTQQKLKDDYMRRDQKHMETISELMEGIKEMRDHISELETKIANQRKEISHLLKAQENLKAEAVNDEKTISSLQANNSMLLKKIGELYDGIRNSGDLTWKEKYDELEEKWKKKYHELNDRYISDSEALNSIINEVRGRLKLRDDKVEVLEKRIKELSEDLKKETDGTIQALKKKCVNAQYGADIRKKDYIISYLENRIKNLEEENEKLRDLINKKE